MHLHKLQSSDHQLIPHVATSFLDTLLSRTTVDGVVLAVSEFIIQGIMQQIQTEGLLTCYSVTSCGIEAVPPGHV